jgi:AcrR family transcriptional regulator
MDASVSRKGRADYLLAGLEVLVTDGPRALTAARMARELSVTTGSFYWHFNAIDVFRDELKRFWRDEIVRGVIVEAVDQADEAGQILENVGRIIRQRGAHRYDVAMRHWAESDRQAAKTVEAADKIRGEFIKDVLQEVGFQEESAADRANLVGAAWLGTRGMNNADYRFKLLSMITQQPESNS